METWDAITARRNVREFADRVIPDADLDRVLETGRIAPSSALITPSCSKRRVPEGAA
jgi:nitroreductase